jgi:hypothetical protein
MCVTAFRPQSDAQHRVQFVMTAGGLPAAGSIERAAVERVALTGLDLQMDLCTDPDGPRAVVTAQPAQSPARAAVPAPPTAADVRARIDRCVLRTQQLVVGAPLKGRLTSAIGARPEDLANEDVRDLGGGGPNRLHTRL